ncbi:hypothetical protein CFB46_29815 [Burkholderia sp. HI2761]|nr:hypothetical protein [Burkholderia sp. BE24]OXJ24905.1 hypothetical protein CFB46_29815 [Burkholderia sp. HI2761]
MSRWMAPRRADSCGARATCCSRVVPEAGAPMSQTRHTFDRRRHRWRKYEGRTRNDGTPRRRDAPGSDRPWRPALGATAGATRPDFRG